MKRTAWPRRLPHTGKSVEVCEQNQPIALVEYASVAMEKIAVVGAKMARISDLPHTACAKEPAHRNRTLLDMAQDRPCLLRIPGECVGGGETTVACHSNKSAHGKGMARKAHDEYTVWGCAQCHRWLDQGSWPAHAKDYVFMRAHADQVLEWRRISTDTREPARFRIAARWALDTLNASPISSATQ